MIFTIALGIVAAVSVFRYLFPLFIYPESVFYLPAVPDQMRFRGVVALVSVLAFAWRLSA